MKRAHKLPYARMKSTEGTEIENQAFTTVNCINNDQDRIVTNLSEIFKKDISMDDFLREIQQEIDPLLLFSRQYKKIMNFTEQRVQN